MTKLLDRVMSCVRGSAAVQFALALPVLVLFIIGTAQMGILFAANAGMQQALGEGARLATLFPAPADDVISARIMQTRFSLKSEYLTAPTFTHGTSSGVPYVDITLVYKPRLNFVFFTGPQITMTKTRRAFQN